MKIVLSTTLFYTQNIINCISEMYKLHIIWEACPQTPRLKDNLQPPPSHLLKYGKIRGVNKARNITFVARV